jgi:hypothetical protein
MNHSYFIKAYAEALFSFVENTARDFPKAKPSVICYLLSVICYLLLREQMMLRTTMDTDTIMIESIGVRGVEY